MRSQSQILCRQMSNNLDMLLDCLYREIYILLDHHNPIQMSLLSMDQKKSLLFEIQTHQKKSPIHYRQLVHHDTLKMELQHYIL